MKIRLWKDGKVFQNLLHYPYRESVIWKIIAFLEKLIFENVLFVSIAYNFYLLIWKLFGTSTVT